MLRTVETGTASWGLGAEAERFFHAARVDLFVSTVVTSPDPSSELEERSLDDGAICVAHPRILSAAG
jgi:hypothetical protein